MRAAVLSCVVLVGSACQRSGCGTTGCVPAFDLMFAQPLTQPGDYQLTLTVDAAPTRCTTRLPEPGWGAGCEADHVSLVHSEAVNGWQLEGLTVRSGQVQRVGLTVSRGGARLAELTTTPANEDWFVNGAECDARPCRYASATVLLDPQAGVAHHRAPQ